MIILVVEDDAFKFSTISELIQTTGSSGLIVHHHNVFATVDYIRSNTPDKIILDMSLPSHPAVAGQGNPVNMSTGGMEIIFELKGLGKLDIPILILTQYPDVEVEYEYYTIEESQIVISQLYKVNNLSVVHYDECDAWKLKTRNFLEL